MSDRIVRPVLKRANSVKQIGTYASDRIDGALDVADQYVDKYLPSEDATDGSQNWIYLEIEFRTRFSSPFFVGCDASNNEDVRCTVHRFQRGKQLSRKLKRRLTQRTVAEARALKKQIKEDIHILVYAIELVSI